MLFENVFELAIYYYRSTCGSSYYEDNIATWNPWHTEKNICYGMVPFIIRGKLPNANTMWYLLTNNSRICYFPLPFLKHAIKIPWHLFMKWYCLSYYRYSSSLFMWLMTCHSKLSISLNQIRCQICFHFRYSVYKYEFWSIQFYRIASPTLLKTFDKFKSANKTHLFQMLNS